MKILIVVILLKLGYNVNAFWRNQFPLNVARGRSTIKCNPQKLHIPNPVDPHSFYKCGADGTPVLFQCPPGTRFDVKLEVCNWDTSVGSTGSSGVNPGSGGSGGTWINPGSGGSGGMLPNPGTGGTGGTWINPGIGGTIPNPGTGGTGGTFPNPGIGGSGGTWTNPGNHDPTITFPNPGTGGTGGTHPNPGTDDSGTQWPSNPGSDNNGNNDLPLGIDCSKEPTDGPVKMFQNPEHCSAYYTCNMGRPVLTYCPRGLFFNPETSSCDDNIPEGCQLVDPERPGGGAIFEEIRKLRLRLMKRT
ncbi:hypothetical protein O3M35_009076 [Rhynocoris fuscipes]|uniref:Chitin-binding type-2 domain-containing protein n=1 Tax=Rhynocoris fuscipes TaxID=488301 RepID=A0AAW1D1L1_9HEMI